MWTPFLPTTLAESWDVEYVDDPCTGSNKLVETYKGVKLMERTDKQKYLRFILSSRGNNMAKIDKIKRKSVWIMSKIFTKLNGRNLKKYYFECAILFMNVMLRSNILYPFETYYNLKEG
jgi:hypothetical protein